jgi:hypothetical protein
MTVAASPPQATEPPQKNSVLISLTLLAISFLLTLYTHNTCPAPNSHAFCTTPNDLIHALAVLLAYLAAVGFYTSPDGKVMFPLLSVSYFGVLGVLVLFGLEDLRAGLGCILGVEVVVVAVFLGVRTMICKMRVEDRGGDEEEARLVGEAEGCGDTGGGGGEDEAALLGQTTRSEEKKGDGRVDDGDGGRCVRTVTEGKVAQS